MALTVYFVVGASRGIGLGLVAELTARDNTLVFAGARDPSTSTQLQALAAKYPSSVTVIQWTAANPESNVAAIAEIKSRTGRLDVVIKQCGHSEQLGTQV